MKIAYIDCTSGAAGDMLLAAMLDLLRDLSGADQLELSVPFGLWESKLTGLLKLEPGGRYQVEPVIRGGMAALKIDFYAGAVHADHHHHHSHRHIGEIMGLLDAQAAADHLSRGALELSKQVFTTIAEVEAKSHGIPLEKVHFHEIGAFDSILDIAGFAAAFSLLHIDKVYASPVTTGTGFVETAHGTLSVPPPAVLEILRRKQIPTSGLPLPGECLTPTGAAILSSIVQQWGEMPAFKEILGQGVGAGTRELATKPNVVRIVYGEAG